jgi:hypothetical protein
MVFMGKIHQLFQYLASFSQNSINTNKVEIGDVDLETKQIIIAVKFASKFITKMLEHIDENSIPKNIPAFVKSLFVEAPKAGFTLTLTLTLTLNYCASKAVFESKKITDDPHPVLP